MPRSLNIWISLISVDLLPFDLTARIISERFFLENVSVIPVSIGNCYPRFIKTNSF